MKSELIMKENEIKNCKLIKKNRPNRIGMYMICDSIFRPIEKHLQYSGHEHEEEVAFLAGYFIGDSIGIVTTALLPYSEHHMVACSVPLDVTAKCFEFMKRKHQSIFAQIHTHPGRGCFHSKVDDDWSVCDLPGFISIVVPCFGRYGVNRIFSGDAKIFERMEDGDWRKLGAEEVQCRFQIIPASFLFI
jgi:hypothetical protein